MVPLNSFEAETRDAEAAAGDILEKLLHQTRLRTRVLFVAALLGGCLSAGVRLIADREWTSRFSFAPQAGRLPGGAGLSSLVAQFGVNVPGSQPSQSPSFYQQLITGQTVLEAIVDSMVLSDNGPVRLANVVARQVQGPDSLVLRERAIQKLKTRITVGVDNKTGVVVVQVRMPSPQIASRTSELLLAQMDEFNMKARSSNARAERVFTEQSARSAERALMSAEAAMREFFSRNRDYKNSPSLQFEYDRLSRELQLRQTVQSSLAQSLEQSRIDEVRDTPTITVVERPRPPVLPDSRGLLRWMLAGALTGALVGLLVSEAVRLARRVRFV
jgi:uncharacterized protein involved in exopolysaccharide biosynthesis